MAESSSTLSQREMMRHNTERCQISLTSSSPLSEELQCSICLDVFIDPVSTPCGHNFCKSCLQQCWDTTQNFHCPLCKETFSKRPDLKINTALRQIVRLFKERVDRKKSDVLCDICDDMKLKALKLCLVCQTSYCEAHLEPHQRVPVLKKHKLVDPVENPEDYICQKHEKPLELFCRDDGMCVCLLCAVTDHKTHNTVAVEEESGDRKLQLMKIKTDVQQMIQDRIRKMQDIKHAAELRKKHSEQEKAEAVDLFSSLISSVERCQAEMIEMMERKQEAAEKQDEDLMKDLELEIAELKRRDDELVEISNTEDHLHLIQVYPSLCSLVKAKNWPEISVSDTQLSVEPLMRALNGLQTLDEKFRETALKRVKQYAVDVTLDPDTAHSKLILSDDRKQVRYEDIKQELSDTPKRFRTCPCVLGKEGFSSGRFYFEVQVKEKTDWTIGVVRASINRTGSISLTPKNGCWTIILDNKNHYKACDSPSLYFSVKVNPEVIGVFVDYDGGLVCFCDVESMSHIYSFTGQTFTERLHPYFSPKKNKNGKNAAPLIITS